MNGGLVTRRDPGAALYQIVFPVESGRGEVVVHRVHLKAGKAGDGRFGPLPHVADHIEEGPLSEPVDRAGRSKMLQVDVTRRLLPFGHIRQTSHPVHLVPFRLGG